MSNKPKNIIDLMEDAGKRMEIRPPQSAWDRLERKLDKKPDHRVSLFSISLPRIVAALALMLLGSVITIFILRSPVQDNAAAPLAYEVELITLDKEDGTTATYPTRELNRLYNDGKTIAFLAEKGSGKLVPLNVSPGNETLLAMNDQAPQVPELKDYEEYTEKAVPEEAADASLLQPSASSSSTAVAQKPKAAELEILDFDDDLISEEEEIADGFSQNDNSKEVLDEVVVSEYRRPEPGNSSPERDAASSDVTTTAPTGMESKMLGLETVEVTSSKSRRSKNKKASVGKNDASRPEVSATFAQLLGSWETKKGNDSSPLIWTGDGNRFAGVTEDGSSLTFVIYQQSYQWMMNVVHPASKSDAIYWMNKYDANSVQFQTNNAGFPASIVFSVSKKGEQLELTIEGIPAGFPATVSKNQKYRRK